MKSLKYQIFLTAIISAFLCISLISCNQISSSEAKTTSEDFINYIANGNYSSAANLMHPDTHATVEYLEKYFERIETDFDVDFNNKVTIKKYTGFSSTAYDSTIDGSSYSLYIDISVDDADFSAAIDLKRTDTGYGIYNITIDKK